MTPTARRRHLTTAALALMALTVGACSSSGNDATSASSETASRHTPLTTSHAAAPTASGSHTTSPSRAAAQPSGNPLTGAKKTTHPVIAVKLENTAAAMPQYGLSSADLVFVEEVEGSLTRLMPVYLSTFPDRVEPVRSARSTDVDILPMFGRPVLIYSGVAPQVRPKLEKAPIVLDSNGSRDSSRHAPHNMFFNVQHVAKRSGLQTSQDIGLRFDRSDSRMSSAAPAGSFTVPVGGDRFSFSYKRNRYLPSWNGRPYQDVGAGGKQVTANNVLVLHVREVSDHYRDPAGHPVYKSLTTGSGTLALYRNGKKLPGAWHRSAANKPFRFVDQHGTVLRLAPGKTWILLQA